VRILVVGDSYLPTSVFADGLGSLARTHSIEYLQLDPKGLLRPRTVSELAIREFEGSPDEVAARMSGVEVLVVHGAPVTDVVLDASDSLRLVCCARGGPVNIDVAAASDRDIPVATTPGKNAEAVAEQTIAFLIMLARGFPKAQGLLCNGGRVGDGVFEGAQFMGVELAGRTLGLVGLGNVGQAVARRTSGFDMRLIGFDPVVEADSLLVEQVDELDELVMRSDFVSLHARATVDNENLFDARRFGLMRSGSFFVNTARETLVDESALDEALSSGRLAGAALDVVRPRREPGTQPLLRHPNVVMTPHIGGATLETLNRGVAMLADEIARFAEGEPLMWVANRPRQYR
jgi:D-3-phosphoglycerate dehydrogenase